MKRKQVVFICHLCGEGILDGDKCFNKDNEVLCMECLEDYYINVADDSDIPGDNSEVNDYLRDIIAGLRR